MILATKGGDATIRDASVGAMLAAEGQLRGGSSATAVTTRSMGSLPAADLAVRIAAEAVAKRKRLVVWRGDQPERKQVTSTWQARFFANRPNERDSWFRVLEQTEASLTARSNAIWLKLLDAAFRVASVYVINPDNVQPRWNRELKRPEYRIRDDDGRWSDWLGPENILHFKHGYPEPGGIWCQTPVERFKTAVGSALAKKRFEGDFYDRGLMQALSVVFDKDVTPEKARRFRELMENEHGGVAQGHGTRVFGGGPTVSTIGLSMADAQFIEGMQFDLEELGRIFNVTPSLLHATAGHGARNAPTPEQEEDRWHRYGLEPRLTRIEDTIQSDAGFFGTASRDAIEFAQAPIRADSKTESDILVHEVQAGIRTANEARAVRGLAPKEGGDVLQVVPVGGSPHGVPDTTGGGTTDNNDTGGDA